MLGNEIGDATGRTCRASADGLRMLGSPRFVGSLRMKHDEMWALAFALPNGNGAGSLGFSRFWKCFSLHAPFFDILSSHFHHPVLLICLIVHIASKTLSRTKQVWPCSSCRSQYFAFKQPSSGTLPCALALSSFIPLQATGEVCATVTHHNSYLLSPFS